MSQPADEGGAANVWNRSGLPELRFRCGRWLRIAARFRHLDLAVLGGLRLRNLNSQHTMCKRSPDVIGPEVTRQGHAILEIPDATSATPQQTLAFLLLDFTSDHKF
ncbi:MAG: hypothetical protein QOK09_3282, partial [Mycobacterium sp.]|nr:hypothetical protein [Mycobacterium sp.]